MKNYLLKVLTQVGAVKFTVDSVEINSVPHGTPEYATDRDGDTSKRWVVYSRKLLEGPEKKYDWLHRGTVYEDGRIIADTAVAPDESFADFIRSIHPRWRRPTITFD